MLINKVSSIGSFGLETSFRGKTEKAKNDLTVFRNGGVGYISRESITKGIEDIDTWKVFVPSAGSGSDSFPHSILGRPFIGKPGDISSWTYMHIGPFENENACMNFISYLSTKLFRFLVLMHKSTQHSTRAVYTFVPVQDFSKPWSDDKLYEKYGLDQQEIDFIESMIKPMEA
jgi:site-specific DNA-methyltransferase (adenine-specific)